jgi:Flp pilus assembly protein TadD
MSSRIDALRSMLSARPDDARLRFGLALEYLKDGRTEEGVVALRHYLEVADDEGNAWGRLGAALLELGDEGGAREAYRTGVEAAERHGHPTMAEEFREVLEDLPV